MSFNLEIHLSRLEDLITSQGRTITEQARTITEQASMIARLSFDTQAHAASNRQHDRQIHNLAQHIFPDGEWVEEGTVDRRARSALSWKLGGEGERKWEWQSHKPKAVNYFDLLPEELMAMIFELVEPTQMASLCQVSYPFLARASLLLYREIVLDGGRATKMFCSRPDSQHTRGHRISQHLSFGNTRKITLDSGARRGPNPSSSLPKPVDVCNDRFVSRHSKNLKLDSVALKTDLPTTDLGYWSPVLSLLDPYHVKLYGEQHDQFRYPRTCPLPSIGCPFLSSWTRLESVTFVGAIVFIHPPSPVHIALVPTIPARRARHIEYQIHQAPAQGEGGKTIENLGGDETKVISVLRERWTAQMGLWKYLRVTLVDDVVGQGGAKRVKVDKGKEKGKKEEREGAEEAEVEVEIGGPAGAAGKRKAGREGTRKRGAGSGGGSKGEVKVSTAKM